MSHPHSHVHPHSHPPLNYDRAFIIGTVLNLGFVVAETAAGFLTNSLTLLADAGHNLSDVLGLLLAWGASWLMRRQASQRYTYGLRRSSILAALLNSCLLLVAIGAIALEAVQRLQHPVPISGSTIIGIACVGVLVNGITALMFASGRHQDLNLKGAFLHMAADALVSLGVVLSGVAILTTGWLWFDPIVSLILVLVIGVGTWNLLKESLNLALDAVPAGIEPAAIRLYLAELPGVVDIHDLHIWAMSTTETALTVHLVMPIGSPDDGFLSRITTDLHDRFGIEHVTIQIEKGNFLQSCNQISCSR
jgi:cobalt-zinc-cadmium efflux system protein